MKGNLPCSPLTSFLIPPITPTQNKHHRLGYRFVTNTAHTMCCHPRHSPSAPVVCLFFKSLCPGSTKVKVLGNSTLYRAQPPSTDRNNRFCSSSPFWLNQTINTWFTAGVINVNMQNIQTESLAYTGIVSLPSFLKSERWNLVEQDDRDSSVMARNHWRPGQPGTWRLQQGDGLCKGRNCKCQLPPNPTTLTPKRGSYLWSPCSVYHLGDEPRESNVTGI